MKIPKQSRREAKAMFRACIADGRLDEDRVRQAVARIIEVKPRGYVAILSHLQRLVKLELERRSARVESPVPLSPELRSDVTRRLGALYGSGLAISFGENPALLGGLRIKVGSDVYDGSVQARLEQLAEGF